MFVRETLPELRFNASEGTNKEKAPECEEKLSLSLFCFLVCKRKNAECSWVRKFGKHAVGYFVMMAHPKFFGRICYFFEFSLERGNPLLHCTLLKVLAGFTEEVQEVLLLRSSCPPFEKFLINSNFVPPSIFIQSVCVLFGLRTIL